MIILDNRKEITFHFKDDDWQIMGGRDHCEFLGCSSDRRYPIRRANNGDLNLVHTNSTMMREP